MTKERDELLADIREQVLYMQELGVTTLDAEVEVLATNRTGDVGEKKVAPPHQISNLRSEISDRKPEVPTPVAGSRLASLPSLSTRKTVPFFDKYNPEESQEGGDQRQETKPILFEVSPTLPEPTETIEQIRAEIGHDCTRCKLSTLGRKQVVNSVGNFNADLMFVGEAPGADEDIQGEPFVGKAGQLLTDIVEKGLQIPRSEVFIGNINRCRPPGNRAPDPDESVVCKPFLFREIAVVRPKVIVVLGATAAQNLLETKVPIGKLRGHFHDHLGTKVMPTFHPAYLLRDPHKKREVWEDMKIVRDYLLDAK